MFIQSIYLILVVCVATFITIIMVQFYKMNMIKKSMARSKCTMVRNLPITHEQWEVREKLVNKIVCQARVKFDFDRGANIGLIVTECFFNNKVANFIDRAHEKSDLDIPPFFASIIGLKDLEKIVKNYETELEKAGISVFMGASCLHDGRILRKKM